MQQAGQQPHQPDRAQSAQQRLVLPHSLRRPAQQQRGHQQRRRRHVHDARPAGAGRVVLRALHPDRRAALRRLPRAEDEERVHRHLPAAGRHQLQGRHPELDAAHRLGLGCGSRPAGPGVHHLVSGRGQLHLHGLQRGYPHPQQSVLSRRAAGREQQRAVSAAGLPGEPAVPGQLQRPARLLLLHLHAAVSGVRPERAAYLRGLQCRAVLHADAQLHVSNQPRAARSPPAVPVQPQSQPDHSAVAVGAAQPHQGADGQRVVSARR